MASMPDIAFLLLIFLVVIGLINYKDETKITYAKAQKLEITDSERKKLEIWINLNGDYYLEKTKTEFSDIENLIIDTVYANPTTEIHLIADRECEFRNLNSILEVLKQLQHPFVYFIAKSEKGFDK